MEVRSELYCHECENYVQFTYDDSLNGNHVIKCPKCGHEHCRVVEDGIVTGDRWDSRNGQTFYTSRVVYTYISTELTVMNSTSSIDLANSWVQVTCTQSVS